MSQCKEYVNSSKTAVVDCRFGWDYNVTEGLRHNIVTEVKVNPPPEQSAGTQLEMLVKVPNRSLSVLAVSFFCFIALNICFDNLQVW